MAVLVPTYASPNIANLSINRGYVEMMLDTEVAFLRMGNVKKMNVKVDPTTLDHFSSEEGVQTADLTVVTRLAATCLFTVEEFTARNMALAMLAAPAGESGTVVLDALTQPIYRAALRFTGTNAVGVKWIINFPLVNISPASGFDLIDDSAGNWASIDLTAKILKDPVSGKFFTAATSDLT